MKRYLKRTLPNPLLRLAYKIVKIVEIVGTRSWEQSDWLSPYQASVLAVLSQREDMTIVVIGANDGRVNDPIYNLVYKEIRECTKMILIEPQTVLLPYLMKNYAFHPRCHFANCAIGPRATLDLYSIKKEFWAAAQPEYAKGWPLYRAPMGVTSSRKSMVLDWARKHIPGLKDPEIAVEKITVESMNLLQLLEREGAPEKIDVLQIDAEGEDDNVIYSCSLEQTRPSLIYFESKSLSGDRSRALAEYLDSLGYVSCPQGNDTLAILQVARKRTVQSARTGESQETLRTPAPEPGASGP